MTTPQELCEKASELKAMTARLYEGFAAVEQALVEAEVRVRAEVPLSSGGKLAWQREKGLWGFYVLPMLPPFKASPLMGAPRKMCIESAVVLQSLLDQLAEKLVEHTQQCDASVRSVELALSWLQKGEK